MQQLQGNSLTEDIEAAGGSTTPFLLVIQTKQLQQQVWMTQFGNTITYMDAIYRYLCIAVTVCDITIAFIYYHTFVTGPINMDSHASFLL